LAERLVISVDPGTTDVSLRVQDVFGHVLALFDLLGHSGQVDDEVVSWRLVSVSMNSPLTVVAEAVPVHATPPIVFAEVARTQKRNFARNVSELKQGRVPDAWRGKNEVKRVTRAFNSAKPSTTRIQVTEVVAGEAETEVVEVTPMDLVAVEKALAIAEIEASPNPKDQVGSVEGRLMEVGTFYNQPAIRLRERKSGLEVWCTVSEAHRKQVAEDTDFEDVWAGHRVLVEGLLSYDRSGTLTRVRVDAIHVIAPLAFEAKDISDPDITQGLSGAEYLERFREGTLG
jgi:hypothetical protein